MNYNISNLWFAHYIMLYIEKIWTGRVELGLNEFVIIIINIILI